MANDGGPIRAEYVTVEIYNQTYDLSGPDAAYLQRLADRVDTLMRKISAQANTVDSLRIAILAAMNLADELAQSQKQGVRMDPQQGQVRVANLKGMLDELLDEGRKIG